MDRMTRAREGHRKFVKRMADRIRELEGENRRLQKQWDTWINFIRKGEWGELATELNTRIRELEEENEQLDVSATERQLEIYRLKEERDNYKHWRETACKYADKLRKALEEIREAISHMDRSDFEKVNQIFGTAIEALKEGK